MVIKSLLKTDYTCIPKPANGVRLQAKLESKNPTGLPVGVVRTELFSFIIQEWWLLDATTRGTNTRVLSSYSYEFCIARMLDVIA